MRCVRPRLTVVSRGTPEAGVLLTCKAAGDWPHDGPDYAYGDCYRKVSGLDYCYEPGCSALHET